MYLTCRHCLRSTEEFYSVTWNTRILDDEQRNILIVGGKSNQLNFIDPHLVPENVLLGKYSIRRKNNRSAIFSLVVHPQQPDMLFCRFTQFHSKNSTYFKCNL